MNKQLIIVNGYPESGKDTFVDYCIALLTLQGKKARKISSVDKVKEAGYLLGWDGFKSESSREFLSKLKDLSSDYFNGPTNYILKEYAKTPNNSFLFVFIREPEEIQYIVKNYPLETTTVLLHGRGIDSYKTTGDGYVNEYLYEYKIDNSGTLEQLLNEAEWFVGLLSPKHKKESLFTKIEKFLTKKLEV